MFTQGDVDGFFGLAIDNLIQFLLILGLCTQVLGFPIALVLEVILPGAALSIVVGNFFYAWQAQRLSARQRAPRRHRAALRHQHRLAVRVRVPGHAAGEARGAGRGA